MNRRKVDLDESGTAGNGRWKVKVIGNSRHMIDTSRDSNAYNYGHDIPLTNSMKRPRAAVE